MTENVDIWPTLLDILDLPPLVDADGLSLLPLILGAARTEPRDGAKQSTFAQLDQTWGRTRAPPRPLVTVTSAGHRLIYHPSDPERAELYQLSRDPTERRNIAAEKPEMVTRLRARVDDYLASRPAPWGEAPSVELDDMMLNQLRALGYKVD
jgi:arylsulfatase A-like enzyme